MSYFFPADRPAPITRAQEARLFRQLDLLMRRAQREQIRQEKAKAREQRRAEREELRRRAGK